MDDDAVDHGAVFDAAVVDVSVVVAHRDCATLRVGDVFLKVDSDQARSDIEVDAMASAPVPTPQVLWRRPPVLALAAVPGAPIARLGQPSSASPAAWAAVGSVLRALHTAPLPRRIGDSIEAITAELDRQCEWLVTNDVLPADLVTGNRAIADAALRPWTPAFIHGDLHVAHVFVKGGEVSGIIDWTEAGQGDPAYDLAVLTLGHPERLDDVLAGYGTGVDLEVVRGWWSVRCLSAIRWLIEHDFDPFTPGGEVDVLRAAVRR